MGRGNDALLIDKCDQTPADQLAGPCWVVSNGAKRILILSLGIATAHMDRHVPGPQPFCLNPDPDKKYS